MSRAAVQRSPGSCRMALSDFMTKPTQELNKMVCTEFCIGMRPCLVCHGLHSLQACAADSAESSTRG